MTSCLKPPVLGREPFQFGAQVIELIETKQLGPQLHGRADLRRRRSRHGNGESTVR